MLACGAVALELTALFRTSRFDGFWLIPAWVGAVLLGVVIFRRLNQDLGDGDQAADFAQVVNVLGLSVLPFRHLVSQPKNQLQALNRTLLVVIAAPTTIALLTMLFRKLVK
jgi:formate-dependent nitrite reductase membrane component NrfD